jgi:hypothetical protein
MVKPQRTVRVLTEGPPHLAWRTPLLAELALARVTELVEFKQTGKVPSLEVPYELLVVVPGGRTFYVSAQGYSSFKMKIEPESIPVLELEVEADCVRTAQRSPMPVVMFLFDADRDHGRYLRLDTLAEPPAGTKAVLSFPVQNTITSDSIRAFVAELANERAVPVAS